MKRNLRTRLIAGAAAVALVVGVGAATAAHAADSAPINTEPGALGGPVEGLLLSLWPAGQKIPVDFRPVTNPKTYGAAVDANPLDVAEPPANPFMLTGHNSNLNNDSYRSNTYWGAGPLGKNMSQTSAWEGDRECTSETVVSPKRMVAICYSVTGAYILEMDPTTLKRLSVFQMPARDELTTSPNDFRPQLTGAGYYYVNNAGKLVMPTATNEIYVMDVGTDANPKVKIDAIYETGLATKNKLLSVAPAWNGDVWFVSRNGTVGSINPATSVTKTLELGETIDNAPTADSDGAVYVATTKALYRLGSTGGTPSVTWREEYPNDGTVKLPQATAGTGTSPTLIDTPSGKYVAITDNADPIDVRVYRRDAASNRLACDVPVFDKGGSATATSMIGAGNSLVVTNQFGYHGPGQTPAGFNDILQGRLSKSGMTRIDVNANGCSVAWTSDARIASGVPKLSTTTGLIYAVSRELGQPVQDVWYLNAIDFRTGQVVWKFQYGSGLTANPNYAAITLGPDGAVYTGAMLGIFRITDGS